MSTEKALQLIPVKKQVVCIFTLLTYKISHAIDMFLLSERYKG